MPRLLVVVVCLLVARAASADPIQIRSGTLNVTGPFGLVDLVLVGDFGFSYTGGGGVIGNRVDLAFCHIACGDLVPAGGIISGSDMHGQATLLGTSYLSVGSAAGQASMFLEWFGTLTLPPQAPAPIAISAPFTATGMFGLEQLPDGFTTAPTLIGAGVFTAHYVPADLPEFNSVFPPGTPWRFSSASYTFIDPLAIPEPASLLLLGAGLIGLWRRRN